MRVMGEPPRPYERGFPRIHWYQVTGHRVRHAAVNNGPRSGDGADDAAKRCCTATSPGDT